MLPRNSASPVTVNVVIPTSPIVTSSALRVSISASSANRVPPVEIKLPSTVAIPETNSCWSIFTKLASRFVIVPRPISPLIFPNTSRSPSIVIFPPLIVCQLPSIVTSELIPTSPLKVESELTRSSSISAKSSTTKS